VKSPRSIVFSLAAASLLLTGVPLFAADADDRIESAVKRPLVTKLVTDISGVKSVVNHMTARAFVSKN
jgi:hypothetical protein